MESMRAISVTFCRDRDPNSPIAPLEPLPPEWWEAFKAGVTDALAHIPGKEIEYRDGHTVWDGRLEQCLTISQLWADPSGPQLATLRTRLAKLAARYDQAAVVLHDETRYLIEAAS